MSFRSRGARSGVAWLAVLVLGVGASLHQLLDDNAHEPQDPHGHAAHRAPERLFDWEPEEATRLRVTSAGRTREFVPMGPADPAAGWRDAATGAGPEVDVSAYLVQFSQARSDREIDPGADAGERFGLGTPALFVELLAADGKVLARLEVGDRTPDGFGRYVRDVRRPAQVLVVPHYQFAPAFDLLGVSGAR